MCSACLAVTVRSTILFRNFNTQSKGMNTITQTLRSAFLAGLLLLIAATPYAQKSVRLFNGRDLKGWHIDAPELEKDSSLRRPFLVRGGNLVSLGTPRGHLITDSVYGNYRLTFRYRFASQPGNCGVLVHASKPRMLYSMFPQSLEVQMEHGNAGDFWCIGEDITVPDMEKRRGPKEAWGVTEGKGRRIVNLTDSTEKPVGQWNRMTIECRNNSVTVWLNGELVNSGSGCTASRGQIALQAEGSEVEFRDLMLTPLLAKEKGQAGKR